MCIRIGKLLALCGVLLFVPLLVCAAAQLSVEPRQINMGEIQQGEVFEQIVQLRNTGDAPLIIDQVKTSCGCTAALLSTKTLAPGKSGELKIVFDSGNFSGQIKKTVTIQVKEPVRSSSDIVLTGQVTPQIEVSPAILNFGQLRVGASKELPLEISNRGTTAVVLARVEALAPGVEVSFERQTLAAGERLVVPIKVRVTATERPNGYVLLHLEESRQKTVRIPLYALVTE